MAETDRAQEVVRRLLDAEKGAQARLTEAEERSRERLAAAREEAERLLQEARRRAEEERQTALATAHEGGESEAHGRIEETLDVWRRRTEEAEPRLADATRAVVDWVCAVPEDRRR